MLAFLQGKEAASSLSCAPLGQGGSWQGCQPWVQLGSTATSLVRKQLVFAEVLTVSLVEAPVNWCAQPGAFHREQVHLPQTVLINPPGTWTGGPPLTGPRVPIAQHDSSWTEPL